VENGLISYDYPGHFKGQLLKSDRRESTSIGPHESQVMRGCDHGTDRGVIAGSNF